MKKFITALFIFTFAHYSINGQGSSSLIVPSNKISTYLDSFNYGAFYLKVQIVPDSFFSRSKSIYKIGVFDQFKLSNQSLDINDNIHYKYKQYYKGLEVYPVQMNFHTYGTKMSVNGDLVEGLDMDTTNKITRNQAIINAKSHFNGAKFINPKLLNLPNSTPEFNATLLIVHTGKNDFLLSSDFRLAYMVNVAFDSPDFKDYNVYIDAVTGTLLSVESNIKSHNAQTCTPLYGNKTIRVQKDSLMFSRLGGKPVQFDSFHPISQNTQFYHPYKRPKFYTFDTFRNYNLLSYIGEYGYGNGSQVESLNPNNSANTVGYGDSLHNFMCNDTITGFTYTAQNLWISNNFLEMLNSKYNYRIRRTMPSRLVSSFSPPNTLTYTTDSNTLKIVTSNHTAPRNNAFWHESSFSVVLGLHDTFSTYSYPMYPYNRANYVAPIDVLCHELGHMIMHDGSRLVYSKESGALDESFADVIGYLTERYMTQKYSNMIHVQDWTIGEDIGFRGTNNRHLPYMRSMANPELKEQPSIYGGQYWIETKCCDSLFNDYCGVHTNSGVHNHWFYLLVTGGSKFHSGQTWTVRPIGIDTLERLFFQTFKFNLILRSKYRDARNAYMISVDQLYGGNPSLKTRLAAAWDAVNVRDEQLINFDYHVKDFVVGSSKHLVLDNIQNFKFGKNLIVDSSYRLTIRNKCLLEFSENSILEVKYSGSLKVVNSTLQSVIHRDSCDPNKMWQGIRVFPYLHSHLFYAGTYANYYDTTLLVSNSTIQHAKLAIQSGYYYTSGDVLGQNGAPVELVANSREVYVNNSQFINNAAVVKFATTFQGGRGIYFDNNNVNQNNQKYIIPDQNLIDILYYRPASLMISLTLPVFYEWDDNFSFKGNKIKSLKDNNWNLTGLRLNIAGSNNLNPYLVSNNVDLKYNKFSQVRTGAKITNVAMPSFISDTFESNLYSLNVFNTSSIVVDSNIFDYSTIGIQLNTNSKNFGNSSISNCNFEATDGNQNSSNTIAAKAIYVSGMKNVNIFQNRIGHGYVNSWDNISSYTGVHLNKTENVKVYENNFSVSFPGYNSVPAVAFFAENNATNLNAFSKNTVDNSWHIGAWVWGENRNLRLRCNQFGAPANAAILVQGNLRNQGLPDGVLEIQGCDSASYPAANQFMWLPSHGTACGISPESAIKVDTSKSNYRFYYNTQSVEGPGSSTPQTPDPLCRTNTYGDIEWKYNSCAYPTNGGKFAPITCGNNNLFNIVKPPHEGLPCEQVLPYIDSFQWRVVDFKVSLTGLLGGYHDFVHLADQQSLFHGLLKESKDIQVSIRRKCSDTLPILRDYLEESPFWEDRVELVEEVLRKKDYTAFATAKAKLDSFSIESIVYQGQNTLTKLVTDKEDLKYIYMKEKAMLQAESNGDTSFQLSESDVEQLFTIQAKQSYAGAVAERVLMKLRDTNFIHPLPSLPTNDTIADINWEQYYNDYPVMIFPNPTEGHIRFEFNVPTPIETASIQIVKVTNPSTYVLVDDFTENFFSRVYDLSDKANGIYIMAIKVNGTIVTAKQFQIYK